MTNAPTPVSPHTAGRRRRPAAIVSLCFVMAIVCFAAVAVAIQKLPALALRSPETESGAGGSKSFGSLAFSEVELKKYIVENVEMITEYDEGQNLENRPLTDDEKEIFSFALSEIIRCFGDDALRVIRTNRVQWNCRLLKKGGMVNVMMDTDNFNPYNTDERYEFRAEYYDPEEMYCTFFASIDKASRTTIEVGCQTGLGDSYLWESDPLMSWHLNNSNGQSTDTILQWLDSYAANYEPEKRMGEDDARRALGMIDGYRNACLAQRREEARKHAALFLAERGFTSAVYQGRIEALDDPWNAFLRYQWDDQEITLRYNLSATVVLDGICLSGGRPIPTWTQADIHKQ